MNRRGWFYYYAGDPDLPSYGTVGNAFLVLQSIVEPHKRYVLEAKQEERAEQDDEGGPDRSGRRRRQKRSRRARRKKK